MLSIMHINVPNLNTFKSDEKDSQTASSTEPRLSITLQRLLRRACATSAVQQMRAPRLIAISHSGNRLHFSKQASGVQWPLSASPPISLLPERTKTPRG